MAKNYTNFDNNYFVHLSQLELSGTELRVCLFLLRFSACYKRNYTGPCSAQYIANGTGISERQVKRALKKLFNLGYLAPDYKHTTKKGASYYLRGDKLGSVRCQTWSFRGDISVTDNLPDLSHKENTEKNTEEQNTKEKREQSSSISEINEPEQELSDEEWDKLWEEGE